MERSACKKQVEHLPRPSPGANRRRGGEGDQQIARRTCRCHENVIAPRVSQISRIDRRWLRPADERRARQLRNQRQQQRANRVGVGDGVQRDPSQALRRVVAQLACRPRVRRLVNTQRKDQNQEGDDEMVTFISGATEEVNTGYLPCRRVRPGAPFSAPPRPSSLPRDARRTPTDCRRPRQRFAAATDFRARCQSRSQIAHHALL